ncbi:MAG: DNA polymerase III subunit delta', partial [Hydrogenobacter sp.]
VRDFLNLKPALSQKKVVLIAPAESMNPYSQNALLKTLEEPPQDTHFILVANNLNKLLSTVRSRCYLIEFKELSKEDIKKITGIKDEEILEFCEGSITKANQLLQKTHIIKLARVALFGSPLELYNVSTQVEKMDYEDQKLFLQLLEIMLHKKLLQNKEKWEFYEPIIDRITFVLDNLKRGIKLSLFLFYLNASLTEVKK